MGKMRVLITHTTDYANLGRTLTYEAASEVEALHFILGYVNSAAETGRIGKIESIEVEKV